MPNKKTHVMIGSVTGPLMAGVYAYREQKLEHIIAYGLGGLIGGNLGGRIADVVDAPTSPNHRSIAHSLIGNLLIYFGDKPTIAFRSCLTWLETKADEYEKAAKMLWAFCCRLLAGILIGVAAGHGIHLIADFVTKKSLPLIF